ncbi:MAG: hypothetical protein SR1Q5_03300 [Quinella sp. 1Q5]|nr:hypothetical protein [Quinella sp. 1Q5]
MTSYEIASLYVRAEWKEDHYRWYVRKNNRWLRVHAKIAAKKLQKYGLTSADFLKRKAQT